MSNNADLLFIDPMLLQQAEKVCRQRLESNPNVAILRALAEVCRKQGKLTEAAEIYEQLYQSNPQDQEAGYLQAVLHGQKWSPTPAGIRAAPFLLLKNFLPQDFHDSLLPYLVSEKDKFVPAVVSDGTHRKLYKPGYRDALDFPEPWESKRRFREMFEQILPSLLPRLQVPAFELDHIGMHVRAYGDGHFFKFHKDTPLSGSLFATRVLSFVYFFHRTPRPYTGGELLLFESDPDSNAFDQSRFTQISPIDNALVVFPSHFYHCVVPIRCPSGEFADSRFVINGFVHRRDAGASQSAASETAEI